MMRRTPLLLALSFLCTLAAGPSMADRSEKATFASLEGDRATYAPGESGQLVARIRIDDGWHVNSHTPTFDYLIPTELIFEWPEEIRGGSTGYPEHRMEQFGFAEQPIAVYDGTFEIVGPFTTSSPGRFRLSAQLRYQACNDRQCLPPTTATAAVEIVVGESASASTARSAREEGAGPSLLSILLLGFLGGVILNAMPCVLPVLSIKVFGLVRTAHQGRRQVTLGALATTAGILVSFWALAAAASGARAAGLAFGWGVQFQQPLFVVALLLVVVLFSLNLWGLFEVQLPGRVVNAAGRGTRDGLAGHFGTGLFATLMATPCSAPFLGPAVGFALAQPVATVFAVFTAVGLGMASPYIALAIAPGSARFLPRPGEWMILLKGAMGFLLAGAGVWLLYVLTGQLSPEQVATIELAILCLALFVWLRSRATGRAWIWVAWIGALAAAGASMVVAGRTPGPVATVSETVSLIPWESFDRDRAEAEAASGRLVFVDVTADWCLTCKVNERLVLETAETAGWFEELDVLAMKADWTNRDEAIGAFLADFGRYSIPFYLLYRPDGPPRLLGELLTKEAMHEALFGEAATR